MTLPEISVRRYVLAYMLSAALILFGAISMDRIGVAQFPAIDFPMVTVTTILPGASPEIIDSSVTNLLESVVNSVPGIDELRSTSSPSVSQIMVRFDIDKNVDVAFNEVQAKINQVINNLPTDAETPIVAKVDPDAFPIMWLVLQGDRTLQQLNQYAENIIKKRLENIDGVGQITMGGGRQRVIRAEIDIKRLSAYGLTTQDVIGAFQTSHIQFPGGFLSADGAEHLIRMDLEFHDTDELANLIIANRGGLNIRLKDVANVVDGLEDYRQLAQLDGKPSVGLGIIKVAGSNTVAIANEVTKRLNEEIRPQLPAGLEVKIATDSARIIKELVSALYEHVILGTILAGLVVLLFLKSGRGTIIISLAIPVSLLAAVAVMFGLGYTFNTMSLLALLLLIGVVVDDSIVVLENIFRHREDNPEEDPGEVAIKASNQVFFAIFAATMTLVAIFGPVIFMTGIIGEFFREFAVVVTFGIMASFFVAITLTPMLCARFLKVQATHGTLYNALENMFRSMEQAYRRFIKFGLKHRAKVMLVSLVVVATSCVPFQQMGKGFMPKIDEGQLMITFKTPLGSDIGYTAQRLQMIEQILERHRDSIGTYFSAIGLGQTQEVNSGIVFITMRGREDREQKQWELQAQLNEELSQIPGVRSFVSNVSPFGGFRGEPLQFVVSGYSLDKVAAVGDKIVNKLQSYPGFGRIDGDLQISLPQVRPTLEREQLANLGISARDIAFTVNVLAGGFDVAKYNDEPGDGERYDVRLKAQQGDLRGPEDLKNIYLRSRSGEMVRLDSIAEFVENIGPSAIPRHNLKYAATYYADPNMPLSDATKILDEVSNELLPPGYSIDLIGQASSFEETVANMILTFSLALILVYMVLASQFNSFTQPAIVMIAQPLAVVGGVYLLYFTGHTINMYSMIGFVLLVGLVAKNSILLVDLTNQYREQGMAIDEALLEACPHRMRPVLMTSMTIILALFPASLGLGAGAETNGPMAVAVIGGMLSSTLLTLLVVPCAYSLLENFKIRNQKSAPASSGGTPTYAQKQE